MTPRDLYELLVRIEPDIATTLTTRSLAGNQAGMVGSGRLALISALDEIAEVTPLKTLTSQLRSDGFLLQSVGDEFTGLAPQAAKFMETQGVLRRALRHVLETAKLWLSDEEPGSHELGVTLATAGRSVKDIKDDLVMLDRVLRQGVQRAIAGNQSFTVGEVLPGSLFLQILDWTKDGILYFSGLLLLSHKQREMDLNNQIKQVKLRMMKMDEKEREQLFDSTVAPRKAEIRYDTEVLLRKTTDSTDLDPELLEASLTAIDDLATLDEREARFALPGGTLEEEATKLLIAAEQQVRRLENNERLRLPSPEAPEAETPERKTELGTKSSKSKESDNKP